MRRAPHTTGSTRITSGFTAIAFIVAQFSLPPSASASHLGSSTASAGSAPPPAVSAVQSFQPDLFTGRATTSIPIGVPPGRKGMQPSLALTYASSARNGWLGQGWELDIGHIERSTKRCVPTYDAADTYVFTLQGVSSDLVQIADGTYRAKDEGQFLRVESKGAAGWEVRDKSGVRYLFGQTAASQIESVGKTFRWALDKVIDPNGNTVTFLYTKDQGQLYLARIDYTGHEPTGGLAPANQVVFLLEDRPDPETSYLSGFAITTAKRLKTIEAKATVDGVLSLARRYELAYATSPRTGRSLLTSVAQLGTDGTTSLPPASFTYQQEAPSYQVTALGQPLRELLVGDVDGNGTTELLTFDPASGSWSVVCAQACPGLPTGTWLSGFGDASSSPLVGDWNGDGKTDVAIFASGTWRFATSSGTNFQTNTIATLSLGSGVPLAGDFNGDGKTDVGTYDNGTWTFAFATGTGFTPASALSLAWGSSNHEPLVGDFNGDGLTDLAIVDKTSGAIEVRHGACANWSAATTWISGFGAGQSHVSADFSDDGRSDVAFYDRSAGRVVVAPSTGAAFGASMSLPVTFTQVSSNDQLQVGDFNGDGLEEPAVFNSLTGSAQLALSQGGPSDLLLAVANGLGGTTSLTYQPSSGMPNTRLPFVTPVVTKATASDGLGNSYSTTFAYEGGVYDAPTKEFRGFAAARVFDADANVALTQFHQDEHTKGRAFHAEFRDAAGNLWTKTDQTWSCIEPYPGVHFAKLDQSDGFTYDGDASFKQTRTRFTYDQYGNVARADEDGDVSVTGDERATTTAFLYNTTAWILNKPSLTQTLDASGAVVAQRRFSYDGATATTTAPTTGNLTKEEEWLSEPGAPSPERWLATTLAYDAYGNVLTVTDALGRVTTNTYDPTGTYLIQITNALGHTRQLAYDPRLGQVTSSTDQNGVTTTTAYDALGRVAKVIGPTDTATLPSVAYEYDLSAVPAKTVTRTRVQSGQLEVLTLYTFTDGLGRAIQTRSPAEDPAKQVVTGVPAFNSRGLVIKQWVPYLSSSSAAYVPLSQEPQAADLAAVSYTYDPPGRVTAVIDPDASTTSSSYDDWTVTVTDANGHKTRRTSDAAGRLATVEEFNGTEVYVTAYRYDALNHLTQVTDAKGNVTTIAYDSLGRKRSMDDPGMGHWTYAYDAVDNLASQTDARGVRTSFAYDALNRVTQKAYTIPPGSQVSGLMSPVSYAYDNPAKSFSKGKLTEITDGSGSSSFEYDQLGRLVKESKTVDGTTYAIQRTYDLLGRLTTLTYPDGDIATYTYNPQGGVETVTLQSAIANPQSAIVTDVTYNAAGQVTKITYGNGVTTDYTYNPQTLRLSHLLTSSLTHGLLQDFSYSFDPVGNVTALTDRVHTATQSFAYDPLNRLTKAVGAYGTLTYAYDPLGNMTSNDGMTMSYGLPDKSKPQAVTATSAGWTMAYDANGNQLSKTPSSPSHALTSSLYSYDVENRLVELNASQEETVTLHFLPGWNFFSLPVIPDDLRVSAVFPTFGTDFDQLAWFDANPSTPDDQRFKHFVNLAKFNDFDTLEYGQGYQIYCANPNGATVTLTGKLPTTPLTRSLGIGWHLLPALGLEPWSLAQAFAGIDAEQVRAYDTTTGSLTTPTQTAPGTAYFVKVRTSSTWTPPLPREGTTRFVYDGDGGRVKQVTANGTTLLLGEVFEKDPAGKTTKYVFAGSERLAAQDSAGALRFYHGDHLGSSNVVTDAAGQAIEVNEHTPFGSLSRHEGTTNVAHKFTGQRQDPASGLVLFPGRAYDPQLGRFLQADPFVQDPADPQSLNRYSYVRNNPLNFTDPSGYKKKRSFFRTLFAAIAAVLVSIVAPEAGPLVFAAIVGTAAAVGDQVGAAADRRASASSSSSNAEAASPRGPPTQAPTAISPGHGVSFLGPVRYADSVASETLQDSWGPDDAIFLLTGLGVSAKAAVTAAREFGPAVLFGLRSLGETGAIRVAEEESPTLLKAGSRFSRFMSKAEAEAVEDTGFLRGGRPGETFFTSNKFRKVGSAKSKLSLRDPPEVRLDFKLKRDLQVTGPSRVPGDFGELGGGIQYSTTGPVEVEIIRKRTLR